MEGSYGYDREALGDGELPLLGAWMGGKRPLPPMLVVEVNAVPREEGRFVYLVEAALRHCWKTGRQGSGGRGILVWWRVGSWRMWCLCGRTN